MGLRFKEGVSVRGVSPEILVAIMVARDVYADEKFDLVVTSCTDGVHSEGSLHYKGDAVDFRLNGIPQDRFPVLVERLKRGLGDLEFQVLSEGIGTPNQHLHVQWKPLRP